MTEEFDDQQLLIQEITTELVRQCVENGLETPFSINITDQTEYTVSVMYIADRERGGIKVWASNAPTDESGKIPPHTFVFPLKVYAKDYRGKVYDKVVHTRH